ncbi:MSHA biogenesis protein MshQ [Vibrio parahaemolyticus]|nr:MSHA biogenesis protein MshQ [Vibrio parahaemolyticus]EGR3324503.1 MSHA biogenesis protein MshQ [Vibrio parahaemolyticus]
MKTLNALLALMLMLPSFVYASQCSVKGQDNFTVSFDVEGDDEYQAVKLKQGSHGYVLWYTGYKRNNTNNYDYLFNEQQLINDVDYNIQITHEAGSNTLKYYRKFEGAANYKLIETQTVNLDNGQYWVVDVGDDVDNIQCSNTVDPGNPGGPINRSPDFEFGTVDNSTCSMTGGKYTCTIHFENTYDASHPKPLVFVMPTIDKTLSSKNPRKTEYPSSISVVHTTHNSATIVQEFPPHQKADRNVTFLDKNSSQVQKELAKVDYFVIEPGVLELNNGAKIVAGTIKTNVAASQYKNNNKGINEQNNGITIDFDDYGLTGFDGKPGVLVQPQTKNNDGINNWFTGMARDANTTSFKLALEKSEVYKKNNQGHETFNILSDNETVAFVAGEGFGYINGQRFWLGQGRTKYTLDQQDPVIDPIYEGCKVYTPFPNTAGFVSPPVLVANKNSRRGNNGGWLRRCDIKKDSVAFIVEEDMQKDRERGHLDEDVGWFMFEKANPNPICDAFNAPVQTWRRELVNDAVDGTLVLSNTSKILGAPVLTVGGDRKRVVGFMPRTVSGENKSDACDGYECHGDEGLLIGKEGLENFPITTSWNNQIIGANDRVTFSEGTNVKHLNVDGVLTLEPGKYWFDSVKINTGGKLLIKEGTEVIINTKALALANYSYMGMDVNVENTPVFSGNMRVNVYGLTPVAGSTIHDRVDIANHSKVVGLIYSEDKVYLSDHSVIYGAVTAKDIDMNNNAEVHAATSCLPPLDDYELTVSPKAQYALMCGVEKPTFTIETRNQGELESAWVGVEVLPANSANNFTISVANDIGSGTYPRFRTSMNEGSKGELEISVSVKNTVKVDLDQTYSLKVTLEEDGNQSQTATFKYVPFKFHVDEQRVIAGQTKPVTAQVLACSDGEQTVVKSYIGTPDVSFKLETPNSGLSDDSLLSYEPNFVKNDNGSSTEDFKLMESGEYTVTLTDPNFVCDPQYADDCPIAPEEGDESQQETVILNGSFNVKSRPWKIAICDVKSEEGDVSNPSTQGAGNGFIPSATSFNVTYKPVVHSQSRGNATETCDYPLTQNYFSSDNTNAPLEVKFSVTYPVGGDLANLSEDNGFIGSSTFTKAEASSGKEGEYVWNEVGSLSLTTNATYLASDFKLDEDSRVIGRFYPKYFQVIASDWNYPGSQSFAYMNQPFDAVEFSVEALNANKAAIKNYANFSTKAEFNLDDIEHYSGRFDAPDFGAGSWSNESDKSIGDFSISNSGQCIGSACWNKDLGGNYPDGPFNSVIGTDKSQIGLIYTYNADPVEFITDGDSNSRLVKQPDIRFGRVDLDDVGGNQGTTLRVPLRVEYWNGSRFIANSDDSQTRVLGETEDGSQVHIWPTDNTAKVVSLGAGGEVSSGSSRSVTATQAEPYRQQTRVWLDLDDSTNGLPWLKYNWDNKNAGEENPSSVVTFGIHRGNDRVIYRGEPGLTGQ